MGEREDEAEEGKDDFFFVVAVVGLELREIKLRSNWYFRSSSLYGLFRSNER